MRTFALSSLAMLLLAATALAAGDRKPNVILFLVDDMGWMDCGAYGSQYYKTPNIDAFARRGMMFTDAYSANPLCSPTRASILTGKYPARHGTTSASGHRPPQPVGYKFLPDTAPANQPLLMPESKNYLDPAEYTVAEAFHDAGYRTAHFGKWHLGLTEPHWPDKQGFDVAWHGKPDPGPGSYFSPYSFRQYQSFPDGPPGEYIVDRMADESLKFITENKDRPFLLHMWQYGVHGPWGHKEEYTREFAKTSDPRGKQGNPIMASMLRSIDESLGRVVAKLEELKLTDNTLIIFSSDNGGNVHSNVPNAAKTERAEDSKPDLIKDWRKWAGDKPPTNNDPLRAGKGTLYEGGVRVPLIVVWPGVVEAGSRNSTPVCSIDFYATMLDMAGLKKKPGLVMDGLSLAPLLKQEGGLERKALFNYFPHGGPSKPAGVTVRAGDWKLIHWYETGPDYPDLNELYNLKDDLGETQNLAAKMPDKVKELNALIDQFLADTGALYPRPNPAYNPKTTTAKRGADRPLQGWVARSVKAEMRDGALVIVGDGRNPFLGYSGLRQPGPVTATVRSRGAGGPAKIQWRTSDQETFPDSGQVEQFELKPGGEWSEATVKIPAKGSLLHIRLYLPAGVTPLEMDWIQLESAKGGPQRWEFETPAK